MTTNYEKNCMVLSGVIGGGFIGVSAQFLANYPGFQGVIGMIITMLLGFFMLFYGRYAVPKGEQE